MSVKVHRFVTNDFTVRVAAVDATEVVAEMQAISGALPLATIGVGRAMVAALLMASQLKDKQEVGILLKGNGLPEIAPDLWPIALFLIVMLTIGIKRYRQTLD